MNVLAARFAELLFIHAASWTYIDCFDTYQRHFGTPLELSELLVESVEDLINKPSLRPIVTVRSSTITMSIYHWDTGCV